MECGPTARREPLLPRRLYLPTLCHRKIRPAPMPRGHHRLFGQSSPYISDGDFGLKFDFQTRRQAKDTRHSPEPARTPRLFRFAPRLMQFRRQLPAPYSGWLLDRLSIQAKTVVVRQSYTEGRPVTVGNIRL